MHRPRIQRTAFTLVEMAIVLVVIGLITGAVFAGNNMLQQSKLQSVVSDYAKYAQAVVQFRSQYKGIPGDMPDATNYWGRDTTYCNGAPDSPGTPGTCNGDGDGALLNVSEELRAWQQLQLAKLIPGNNFTGTGSPVAVIGTNIPGSRINGGGWGFMTNTPSVGGAYWYNQDLGNMLTFGSVPPGYGNSYGNLLTPTESQLIDKKIDDGTPAYGRVVTLKPAYPYATNCATSAVDASALYNVTYRGPACALMMSLNLDVSQH